MGNARVVLDEFARSNEVATSSIARAWPAFASLRVTPWDNFQQIHDLWP
jgi:hypothetical protein